MCYLCMCITHLSGCSFTADVHPGCALKWSCFLQGRKRAKTQAKEPPGKQSSTAFLGKDTGLALFHALGKVLYNKRIDPSNGDPLASGSRMPANQPGLPSWSKEIANYGTEQRVADRLAPVLLTHLMNCMDNTTGVNIVQSQLHRCGVGFLQPSQQAFPSSAAIS